MRGFATSFAIVIVVACEPAAAPSPAASASGSASPATDDLGAMTEYMRKSKAAEAKVNLAGIARGVQSARDAESFAPDGTVVPFVLNAAPLTPADGPCCKQPKGRCPGGSDQWQHPSWKAIGFELSESHDYAYELVVDPSGFIAKAHGDLDCDGERSTYELRGTLRPDGGYEIAAAPTSTAPLE
jgi:hypothetical protein